MNGLTGPKDQEGKDCFAHFACSYAIIYSSL